MNIGTGQFSVTFPKDDPDNRYFYDDAAGFEKARAQAHAAFLARRKAARAAISPAKKVKARATFSITTAQKFSQVLNTEIANFVQRLPSLLTFRVKVKKSFRAADGALKRGNFAVIEVLAKTKRSFKTLFDELALGTIPENLSGPLEVQGQTLASSIESALKAQVSSFLPQGGAISPIPASPPPSAQQIPELPHVASEVAPAAPLPVNFTTTEAATRSVDNYNSDDLLKLARLYWESKGGADAQEKQYGSRSLDLFSGNRSTLMLLFDKALKAKSVDAAFPIDNPGDQIGNTAILKSRENLQSVLDAYFGGFPVQTAARRPSTPSAPAVGATSVASLFLENTPYKYLNNPTIYIYFAGQLHGVVSSEAFARFYGVPFVAGMDLNTIKNIKPIPDLTNYSVPANFFDGTLVS